MDTSLPLSNSIVPLILLVSFEILSSFLGLKSVKFRYLSDGKPITIIRKGKLDQKNLKKLRFTINDVSSALRQKDIFNIEDVEFAVVETNGTLSVLLKPEKRNSTPKNYDKPEKDTGMPCAVVIDGKIIKANFEDCGITEKEVTSKIKSEKLNQKEILLMTVDASKNYYIITKREC